jgi:hypothetical protein
MNEKTSILGACNYSLLTLESIKKQLMDIGAPNSEVAWAVGGIIITLTSKLLKICNDVFNQSALSGNSDAKIDILRIREEFEDFINDMVNHE